MLNKIFVALIVCFFVQPVFASVEFLQIEVINLYDKGDDEFVLIFKPIDNIPFLSKTQFTYLHIRFNANCVTQLKQSDDIKQEKEKYLAALAELKDQISNSKTITFGLKSGKGFHKMTIKASDDHYQCDNLSLLIMGNRTIIYAVHADINYGYCE